MNYYEVEKRLNDLKRAASREGFFVYEATTHNEGSLNTRVYLVHCFDALEE